MTLNPIETLKISTYSPKHNKHTKHQSQTNQMFIILYGKRYFSKISKYKKSALYGIIYILCWGPHRLTSVILCWFAQKRSLWGPLRNPVDAKMAPDRWRGAQVARYAPERATPATHPRHASNQPASQRPPGSLEVSFWMFFHIFWVPPNKNVNNK